mmetsp:Transcript_17839/g.20330  ORF Transcript_17839/g.20330 Transcript_17839/m.20330 type:complete len:315 (+) Transcript_17839:145-1089(+)
MQKVSIYVSNMKYVIFIKALLIFHIPSKVNAAFGTPSGNSNPSYTLTDRFRATCPADLNSIAQFDPALVDDNESSVWVAVFRSNNNLPSVLVKDDFMNAMRIATTVQTASEVSPSTQINNYSITDQIETSTEKRENIDETSSSIGVKARIPVAIAKLSQCKTIENTCIIEAMRCSLKKEDTDDLCDGLSEHADAISICIDELILHHLRTGGMFDGVLRTKATLVSSILLESRGFQEVTELTRDMTTHVSSLDMSLIKYSERVLETVSRSPGARDRALQILSFLGKQEPRVGDENSSTDDDDNGDYDPWATSGIF